MSESLGIYIHFPFCVRKCAYCDFYSVTKTELMEAYTDALISSLSVRRADVKGRSVDTVYIGGGTPSLLDAELMQRLFEALRENFRITSDAEITMEANTGTLTASNLAAYRSLGINRLSIGLQSADNKELKTLSRIHTVEEFESSYLLARLEDFTNINIDIMYALPGQTPESFERTIDYALNLNPEHLSVYGLKIEENTTFYNNEAITSSMPDDDTQYRMYMKMAKTLDNAGIKQYEISNFARPGYECRHNLKYWLCSEYLGFGPGAYSYFDGAMFSYSKNLDKFISSPCDVSALLDSYATLTPKELATQIVMLGFRLREGVDGDLYNRLTGRNFVIDYREKLAPFIEKRLCAHTQNGFRLTRRGMLVSNYILSEILDFGK